VSATPTARADPRPATLDEASRISEVLAVAFHDDPVLGWLLPADKNRHERLRRFFALELHQLAFKRGTVWTCDGLAGAALWTPPRAWARPRRTYITHGPEFLRVFGPRLPNAIALQALIEFHHLRLPHYYLAAIGVAPAAQGNGVGSALIAPTLARCDRDGVPAYLEATSERNAALYERHGFRVRRELRLGSSPPLWLMIRPPTGADAT
jgi:GNAT superfamily N-acetyltransferase